MKYFFISITLLFLYVNSITVDLKDVCQCTDIQDVSDCFIHSACEWDSTTKKCNVANKTKRFISNICTNSGACLKQKGCAFSDNGCRMMDDCQSYFGKSNAECQQYSLRCNWNKELQSCTSSDVCSQYSGEGQQPDCESVTQQNGDKWCKFDISDNKCSTKTCSDYEKTTNADCATVLQDVKCISDNIKCLSQLLSCGEYTVEQCLSVIASNGPCELNGSDQTKCQTKSCDGAKDSKTDSGCDTHLKGCITNNFTCFFRTLPSCTTYTVDDCAELKGHRGNCVLSSWDNPTCRDPICEDYTESTDQNCKKKYPSCITNGVYCVSKLADKCDSYTIGNCDSLFTKEGKCISTNSTNCALKSCIYYSKTTNEDCKKYSDLNCITNGVYCVSSLADTCSIIKVQENSRCESYISKEGKCKSKDESQSICELASCQSQIFTSDEECNKYSSNGLKPNIKCKTNGVRCEVNVNTCDSYLKEKGCSTLQGSDGQCMDDPTEGSSKCTIVTCDKISSPSAITCPAGNSTCKFDGKNCVKDLKTCENYTLNCDDMISSNAKPCTKDPTDSTKCLTKSCITAPTNLNTNEDCNKYIAGCVTTGQGCIAELQTCDSYKGIKSTCEKYIGTDGNCTADDANKEEDKCKPKDCANAPSATNDKECNTYSNNCFYSAKIQKCQKKVQTCYVQKTQIDCENSLVDSNYFKFCTWNGKVCYFATCNTIQNVKSKEACAVYGDNCEFDNINACKDKTNYSCSTHRLASLCLQDSELNACVWDTSNKTCIKYNKCSDYQLTSADRYDIKTDEQISRETEICKQLSKNCYSNGSNTCISKILCSVIKEQKNCISSLGIDDKVCGYDTKAKVCKTFGQCSDVELVTHADCQQYSPTCTTDGKTCIAMKNCADAATKELCDIGGIDGKCFWNTESNYCSPWTCENGIRGTHDACQRLSASCTTDGSRCMNIGNCYSYTDQNCILGLENTPCFYDKEYSACRDRVCTDYTSVTGQYDCDKTGCAYDPDAKACMDIEACHNYKKEAICNVNKSKSQKECVWSVDNISCIDLSQCSNASSNQEKCEKMWNCYFVPSIANGTTINDSECKNMDCYGKNQHQKTKGLCNPFKTTTSQLTFCTWNDTLKQCTEGDPSKDLSGENCFALSQYTYFWNTTAKKCVSCKKEDTKTNNTTNKTNITINITNKGFRLQLIIYILLLFQLI